MLAGEERNLRPRRGQRPEQLARLVPEERGLESSYILTLLLTFGKLYFVILSYDGILFVEIIYKFCSLL